MTRGRPFAAGNRYAALGDHQPGRAFKRELTMAVNETDGDATKLRRIAEALIERAIAGDVAATSLESRYEGIDAGLALLGIRPLHQLRGGVEQRPQSRCGRGATV